MFEQIKRNIHAETKQKLSEKLSGPAGESLMSALKNTDKDKLMQIASQIDTTQIDFEKLNAALQNADIDAILRALNGGAAYGR